MFVLFLALTFKVNSALTLSLRAKDGLLYTCRADGFINCYNLTTNELLRSFEGHKAACWSLVLENNFMYTGGQDNVIKKWDLLTGRSLITFTGIKSCFKLMIGHKDDVHSLASVGDYYLISASFDSTVKQWDKTTGELIRTVSIFEGDQVSSVAVSSDGLFVIAASQNPVNFVVKLRVSDGAKMFSFEGLTKFNFIK
jgi:WD40 repeat protein